MAIWNTRSAIAEIEAPRTRMLLEATSHIASSADSAPLAKLAVKGEYLTRCRSYIG